MREFLDTVTMKHVDSFYVLLIHASRYSVLPELYEVFGKENLLRFLNLFAGDTIVVPSPNELKKLVRDVDIYTRLKLCRNTAAKTEVSQVLAKEHNLEESSVLEIYSKTCDIMKTYDIELLK